MEVSEDRPEDRDALDHDCAGDFGGVPKLLVGALDSLESLLRLTTPVTIRCALVMRVSHIGSLGTVRERTDVIPVSLVPFVLPTHANRSHNGDPENVSMGASSTNSMANTYTMPKLIVIHKPTFSTLRISNDRVINQGKDAKMKSIMMLYTENISHTRLVFLGISSTSTYRYPPP